MLIEQSSYFTHNRTIPHESDGCNYRQPVTLLTIIAVATTRGMGLRRGKSSANAKKGGSLMSCYAEVRIH